MEMIIDFPGGARVDAHFEGFTVHSDQPVRDGGENTAPSPFLLFLASLGTCAGYYVSSFCQKRNLPLDGIQILQRTIDDPTTHMVRKVEIEIRVPSTFPEKYWPSLVRSAEQCKVKKHLEQPPVFEVYTRANTASEATTETNLL